MFIIYVYLIYLFIIIYSYILIKCSLMKKKTSCKHTAFYNEVNGS